MKPRVNISVVLQTDSMKKFKSAVGYIATAQVLVGVPKDKDRNPAADAAVGSTSKNQRKLTGGANNATLTYVHNKGTVDGHIPPRPTIEPGIRDAKEAIVNYQKQAADAALEGDKERAIKCLHAVGLSAVSAIKLRIRSNTPPPLKQTTITARLRRGVTRTNTLVDTAQMLNAQTYILRTTKKG